MPALAPATITGLARTSGVDVASVRFYERLGLVARIGEQHLADGPATR